MKLTMTNIKKNYCKKCNTLLYEEETLGNNVKRKYTPNVDVVIKKLDEYQHYNKKVKQVNNKDKQEMLVHIKCRSCTTENDFNYISPINYNLSSK